jgi:hypothetical protein
VKKLLISAAVVMCAQFLPVAEIVPIGSPLISVAEARVKKTVRVRTHVRPNGTQVQTYTWTRRRH